MCSPRPSDYPVGSSVSAGPNPIPAIAKGQEILSRWSSEARMERAWNPGGDDGCRGREHFTATRRIGLYAIWLRYPHG